MSKQSKKAENLQGSEILKFAQDIQKKIASGTEVYNLSVGDFDPKIFTIPDKLKELIKTAYDNNETNYPPADGVLKLKKSIKHLVKKYQNLDVDDDEILVAAGGRPVIYSIYQTIVDPGDHVLYPIPSWNNNHYCYLTGATPIEIETKPENGFLPTVDEILPYLKSSVLLSLCSPSNPSGAMFTAHQLKSIVDAVVSENESREVSQKPLYIMFDQIYSLLHLEKYKHIDPISLNPAIKPYIIYVDGISKSFASTGVRVGWAIGPKTVIANMKSILGHIGAWAPKPEQIACSKYFELDYYLDTYLQDINTEIEHRVSFLSSELNYLSFQRYPVRRLDPQGSIYLSVQFPLIGLEYNGIKFSNSYDITSYLLNNAGIGIIPFTAFGCNDQTDWFRLSVGTLSKSNLNGLINNIKTSLEPFLKGKK